MRKLSLSTAPFNRGWGILLACWHIPYRMHGLIGELPGACHKVPPHDKHASCQRRWAGDYGSLTSQVRASTPASASVYLKLPTLCSDVQLEFAAKQRKPHSLLALTPLRCHARLCSGTSSRSWFGQGPCFWFGWASHSSSVRIFLFLAAKQPLLGQVWASRFASFGFTGGPHAETLQIL